MANDKTTTVTKPSTETKAADPAAPLAVPPKPSDLFKVAQDSGKAERPAGGIPYVGYYGAKTVSPQPLIDAGIKVGEYFLHDGLEPLSVKPFTLHVLNYARFYTKQDQKMNITATRLTSDKESWSAGFREHLFLLVAVRIGAGKDICFVPAVCTQRGGMTDGWKAALDLIRLASNPNAWAVRSPAHKASIVGDPTQQHPGSRVVLSLWATVEETEDESSTFNLSHGTTKPTPQVEAEAFVNWYTGAWDNIARVAKINNERIEEARTKLVK